MKTLVLLHGALGCQKSFHKVIPLLASDYDVRVLDFPLHGQGSRVDHLSIPVLAQAFSDFIRNEKIAHPLVFGYSMGGYVALYAALHLKIEISALATYGTKFQWSPESGLKESGIMDLAFLEQKMPSFANQLKAYHQDGLLMLLDAMKHMLLDLGNKPDLTYDDLMQIPFPVAIGWGAQDRMVSLAESELASGSLSLGHLVTLPNQPHPLEMIDASVLSHFIKQALPS